MRSTVVPKWFYAIFEKHWNYQNCIKLHTFLELEKLESPESQFFVIVFTGIARIAIFGIGIEQNLESLVSEPHISWNQQPCLQFSDELSLRRINISDIIASTRHIQCFCWNACLHPTIRLVAVYLRPDTSWMH